ncbi:MAG: WD40 repeat domain-containing protein [Dechloromonas sp.]|nr:WD40 repeat domain-containing protein [Candidatus Dechloromonas phosphoritropha]MBP8788479.1 WD40 repeat domain-containing protein [Azonexus sp.]MBP9227642.1 WD40 repeat domain-containing protein [Azonexus sp.]
MTAARDLETCPYVGLQPFLEEHREYFFGRQKDQRIIIANVLASPLTVFYGSSGVGKSSVLMAGVVPQLHRDRPRIPVVVFREWVGEDFQQRLARACIAAVRNCVGDANLPAEDLPLDELLRACCECARETVLVILDQFEEYFLYHEKGNAPTSFEAQLARAINREDVDVGFLIAMREDSLAKLDRFQERIPNLLSNRLRLKHLDADGAAEAIRCPLEVWNRKNASMLPVSAEDALVSALIEQVRAGRVSVGHQSGGAPLRNEDGLVEAPFLQLVLTRLWSQEMAGQSRVLRRVTFDRLGGAQEIVRSHLGAVMSQLDETSQAVCATFFDRLVTPSGGKVACARDDLLGWAGPLREYVPQVLHALSEQRILRTTASAIDQPEATYYEIYHDVLAAALVEWRHRYVEKQEREAASRQQQEEARRRRQRRLLIVASAFALITVPGWLYSFIQHHRAEANASAARVAVIAQTDPVRALDVAIAAADETRQFLLPATPEAEDALRQAIRATGYEPRTADFGDWVWGVGFSPNGDKVAVGTRGRKATVWSLNLDWPDASAPSLSFDQDVRTVSFLGNDGRLLVTAGKVAYVWDLARPEIATAFEHGSLIYDAVAISADGKRLATAGQGVDGKERLIKVWDLQSPTSQPLAVIDLSGAWVMGLAFSPDGCCLATVSVEKGAADRTHTEIWGIATRKRLLSLPNRQPGDAVQFTPDGKKIVVAGRDNRIRIFEPAKGELDEILAADAPSGRERLDVPWDIDVLAGHTDRVRDIAISPDGSRIASASGDQTVRIWDSATGESLLVLKGHRGWVEAVAFSADGRRVASGGRDNLVKVWDISRHTSPLHGVAFSPDGRVLATAAADGIVKIWDVSGDLPALRFTLAGHKGEVYRVAFDPTGRRLATASFDNTARLWDVATGQPMEFVAKHDDQLRDVAFSPDGSYLATASADGHARLYRWNEPGAESNPVLLPKVRAQKYSQIMAVAFHPGDATLVTVSSEGLLKRWSRAGEELGQISLNGVRLGDVAISTDGSRLAALAPRALYMWAYADLAKSTADSQKLIGLPRNTYCYSVAFSADGKQVAVACEDSAVRLYDAQSGELVKTMTIHNGPVGEIAFSPDGKRIATASADRTFAVLPGAGEDVYRLATRIRQCSPTGGGD